MKNYICFTFFIASFWDIGQSGTNEIIGNKKFNSEVKVRDVRSHLNGLFELFETHTGGKSISKFAANNGEIGNQTNYDGNAKVGYYNDERVFFERNGNKFGFDDGNPDVHGIIQRPCQAYDTFCIRKFFAEHSKCKISGRKVPNPFYRRQGNVNYPSANISGILVDAEYGGLDNARVAEFYIDTVTDNLVIAISFDSISYFSNNTNIKFYLRGREPEVHRGTVVLANGPLTITMVIPGLHDLRLDRAEITAYIDNPFLRFVPSPSIAASTNPEVLAMATYFITLGVPIENTEQLTTEAAFYSGNYLQYNICDFGLKYL